MKRLLLILAITILFIPEQGVTQASISVDNVDGLFDGKIVANSPVGFNIRWINNSGTNIGGLAIGYRVYLRNNVELANGVFDSVVIEEILPTIYGGFDVFWELSHFSNGIGSDTVGIVAASLFAGGLPNGFNQLVYKISTSVSTDFISDSLCIDSSFFPPSGTWRWAVTGGTIFPDWSGPYCYEIIESCCIGTRGNVDNSSIEVIDIADLVALVDYMFQQGLTPACLQEADFNGSGDIDISDLVKLVSFMFLGGPPPADCQ